MTGLMRTHDRGMLPLRDAFDRLFESAFTPVYGNGEMGSATVATNVWETGDGYQVAMLIPGVSPDSVEVSALRNTITVAGKLEVGQPEGARAIWQEFGPSQFRRQIGLPADVDADKIEAAYRDGVLLLRVPKAEHAKPRQIKLQTGK
jgi:HSP20 family protein